MSSETEEKRSWQDAWERGRAMLSGVTRRRVPGSDPDVEIALLDWGGEGDLAVLHHANGFCGALLAPIAKALSDRFRVVTIDTRGHGDSTSISPSKSRDAYAWSTLAADMHVVIAEILRFVGVDRVELAIGHSFGGALVLAAAQREPARFGKILLCDPVVFPAMTASENALRARESGLAASARKRRDRFPTREEAFAHLRSRALFANFTEEALALYVGEGTRETSDGDFALKCAREVEAAVFEGAALDDLFVNVEKITAEVLILYALHGNFEREGYDALVARIPRARVESLPVGHLFPMEEPERVLASVDEFTGIR